jgi:DNA-binding transcriptional LysR family regulator
MDIRQLRYFMEIARQNNFTKAANLLHIAQPAVSVSIKKLEEELDLILFNRQEKKISLTAEGEIFLEHVKRILDEVKAAEMEMGALKGLDRGEVRLGIPPMLGAYFFPRIISGFMEKHPGLHLSVYGDGSWKIQSMLSSSELDMGVIVGSDYPDDLEVHRFMREEVVVCVNSDHQLAQRSSISYQEFAKQDLAFYKEGYYLRELIFDMLKKKGIVPNVLVETNLFSLVAALVMNGKGVSVCLRMVTDQNVGMRAISFEPPLYMDLMIAWKQQAYLSRANRAFVEYLLEQTRGSQTEVS